MPLTTHIPAAIMCMAASCATIASAQLSERVPSAPAGARDQLFLPGTQGIDDRLVAPPDAEAGPADRSHSGPEITRTDAPQIVLGPAERSLLTSTMRPGVAGETYEAQLESTRRLFDAASVRTEGAVNPESLEHAYAGTDIRAVQESRAQLPSLLKATLAVESLSSQSGQVSLTQPPELRRFEAESERRALLRKYGLPEELLPYLRISPLSYGEQPIFYVPRNWQNPEGADPFDASAWLKQVGPDVEPVPEHRPENGAAPSVEPVPTAPETTRQRERCGGPGRIPCFHSAVALLTRAGALRCSGVLVAPDWVLTAAHCACPVVPPHVSAGGVIPALSHLQTAPVVQGDTRGRHIRFFGEVDRRDDRGFCAEYAKMLGTEPGTPDRTEAERTVYSLRDLALIPLSAPLQLPGAAMVAQLLAQERVPDVGAVRIASLGISAGLPGGGLKTFFPAAFEPGTCQQIASETVCLPDFEIAFQSITSKPGAGSGGIAGTDTCGGDSGGGVFVSLEDGSQAVIALTSRGINTGCGGGGIYVRVADSAVIDWINEVLADDGPVGVSGALSAENQINEEIATWQNN